MLTFVLAMAGVAVLTGGAIAYGFKDKNARSFILAVEFLENVSGRITSGEIKKFKNKAEFDAFVDEEREHADSATYDPHAFMGIKTVYIAQGSEEKLREMKKNCRNHATMQKYVDTQTSEFSIIVLNIKPKSV